MERMAAWGLSSSRGRPGSRRVDAKGWLAQNYMLVQLTVMLVALSLRLIMTNGTPLALAGFCQRGGYLLARELARD